MGERVPGARGGVALESPGGTHWAREARVEHLGHGSDSIVVDGSIDISLIVPTRNEAGNIDTLVDAVTASLEPSGRSWELIFVDDSDDATPDIIRSVGSNRHAVSLLHRSPGHRRGGLSSAVVAGYEVARGRVLVVMDGDLQHPPDLARRIATPVLTGETDLVIASRYVPGASAIGLGHWWRRLVSAACTMLVYLVVPATRQVKDPLSGFFAVSRRSLEGVALRPHGFKILLEVVARSRRLRVMEVPFTMGERGEGQSKAGLSEGARFAWHLGRLACPDASAVQRVLLWLGSQLPLGAILVVQTWLSVKLIYRNTAFVDEATYLSAGHYEIYTWSHPHSANMHLATYFSGAPTIYPIIAAWADNLGGLAGARYLSMGFMLIATLALYAAGRRLWGRPGAWFAAGLWVTTQGVQFLGSFATYDAMALMIITVAGWIVVRAGTARRVSSWIYVAGPVMVLANATKYATGLYDPIVVALAFFVVARYHSWRTAVQTAATLTAFLIITLAVTVAVAPSAYLTGITSTTLTRTPSDTPTSIVWHTSWGWIGTIAIFAAAALVLAATLGLVRRPVPQARIRRRASALVGILAVGAVAVWLAPLNQARIHTETSLSKHVTFGAWFAALTAGWLFSHLLRRDRPNPWWRYPICAVVLVVAAVALVPAGIAGKDQADHLDSEWSNSTNVINALRPLVAGTHGLILMDNAEVARYYLENEAILPRWVDTFYFGYTPPGSTRQLVGPAAYAAAIKEGVFSVVALDYGEQIGVDRVIADAVHNNRRYSWIGDFTGYDNYGRDSFVVWKLDS